MKLKALLLIAALALFAVSLSRFDINADSPAASRSDAQKETDLDERIRRVENGLLLSTVIKGQPRTKMNLTERMAYYKAPGMSIAVINNNKIEWARGYGVIEAGSNNKVTTETLFQAASISKPVAAMGALYLVERGKLGLDEDVNKKLVSWKVPDNQFTKEKKVTLRGLLSHSAGMTVHGFPGYASDKPVPTLVELLDGRKPANTAPVRVDIAPGTKWRYSGGGISVAQLMMMDVTGKPFPQFMKDTVLDKMGMKHSTYEQPLPKEWQPRGAIGHRSTGEIVKGRWHTYPEMAAAGLWTTPSDLARFAIEIRKSLAGKSSKVLSKEMTAQMLTKQMGDYGLGIAVGGSGRAATFSHGGSNEGFRCMMFAYAETGQGAVVMTNSDNGSQLANEIFRSIAAEYGWPDYQVKEREVAKVDGKVYESYAGKYEVMGVTVTISADNGRLFISAPPLGPDKVELYPESETKYFMLIENVAITFVKDEKNQVSEMIIHPGGETLKAKRIK